MTLGEVCQHGQLKRQCQLCEKDARIAELEEENDRHKDQIERTAFAHDAVTGMREADEKMFMERIKELEARNVKLETAVLKAPGATAVTAMLERVDRRDELLRKCLKPAVWLHQMNDDDDLTEEQWAVLSEIFNDPYWKEILPSNDPERKI